MSKITYSIKMAPSPDAIRGNCCVTEDKEADERVALHIIEQLNAGNDWAWCDVTVVAELRHGDFVFRGEDHLGQCSYEDEQDFKEGGYYSDMCDQSRDQLRKELLSTIERAGVAATLLLTEF